MKGLKQRLFELVSYSIILAVLVTMGYTLTMIYFYNSVTVLEPNRYILINEIFMMVVGISFVVYKMKEIFY
ncbi:MAG TPA: hypothetical protein VJJ76_00770 [archaeon]|nr:hypothetical protein [archaeon]